MTERRETYRAGLVTEQGDYKLFLRSDSDTDIRRYMDQRYGAYDYEIVYTGGGKLAGPVPDPEGRQE